MREDGYVPPPRTWRLAKENPPSSGCPVFTILNQEGGRVAEVSGVDNARLVLSAPELLKVVRAFLHLPEVHRDWAIWIWAKDIFDKAYGGPDADE